MAKSKVLIENDKTIVTEWSFDIGDSTGLHTHEYNYIVVPMLDGELKVIDNNSHETISKLTKGGAYYREKGIVKDVDAMKAINEVTDEIKAIISNL